MGLEPNRREQLRQQSLAWEWVSRVLAICVVMVLPGLGGGWLDRRYGTGYWTLAGFAFGFLELQPSFCWCMRTAVEPKVLKYLRASVGSHW